MILSSYDDCTLLPVIPHVPTTVRNQPHDNHYTDDDPKPEQELNEPGGGAVEGECGCLEEVLAVHCDCEVYVLVGDLLALEVCVGGDQFYPGFADERRGDDTVVPESRD
jgi:hypothetical protein